MPNGDDSVNSLGAEILKDLVKNLVLINRNSEMNRDLFIEIRDLLSERLDVEKKTLEALDELCGRFEAVSATFEILRDVGGNGKRLSWSDFLHAYTSAEEQVFGEGEEDGIEEVGRE